MLNAVLVQRLVAGRWAGGGVAAWVAALVFALHPLHPNTVLFVASFATLFGASFALISLLAYERHRSTSGGPALIASLASFVLALGCYEQAVILPLLAWAHELLEAWRRRSLRWRAVLPRVLPFAGILGLYFVVRRAALGDVIGGYTSLHQRFLKVDLAELARNLLAGFVRLAHPDFSAPVAPWALAATSVILLAGTTWSLVVLGHRSSNRGSEAGDSRTMPQAAVLWIFGLFWIVATQAPFAFGGVVPATGRYFYLTAIGLGLMITAGGRVLASFLRPSTAAAVPVLGVVLVLYYLVLLRQFAGIYLEAGDLASGIQKRLGALRETGHEQVFVVGQPQFVENRRGVRIAQVFHWGLADALEPPFAESPLVVYILPRFSDAALLPAVERPDLGAAFRYRPEAGTFEPLGLGARPEVARIESRRTAAGGLRFLPSAARHRLVVVARANTSLHRIASSSSADGWIDVPVPNRVVESMVRLYGSETYGWVEGRSEDGQLQAVSQLHVLGGGSAP
ncbi:MAG: hypothetical protein GY719_17030 [bacterium]|nr:hypothetical protein [bacterium]